MQFFRCSNGDGGGVWGGGARPQAKGMVSLERIYLVDCIANKVNCYNRASLTYFSSIILRVVSS